ncbi:MAG TPA: tetratricopeptide repeat protein [Vicinamibacteria bacterium]
MSARRSRVAVCALALVAAACGRAPSAEDWERRCQLGLGQACVQMVRGFEQRCQARDAGACGRLATSYLAGRIGPPDPAKAALARERGCLVGDGAACEAAAAAYASRDPVKEEQLWEKACELGRGAGCGWLAAAAGGQQQAARAAELERRADGLFRAACQRGEADGCYALSQALRAGPATDEAQAERYARQASELWQKACEAGAPPACFHLAVAYDEEPALQAPPGRAEQLLDRACQAGAADACAELGHLLVGRSAADAVRGAALLERACRAGSEHRAPCGQAGFLFADGERFPADKPRALDLLERACALGEEWPCFKVGTLYRTGDGVPADPARARELLGPMWGLELRVAGWRRATEAVDPTLTAYGIPPSSLKAMHADPGQDFVTVGLEITRAADQGRLPVRRLFLVDAQGGRVANHAEGDAPLGEKPFERREYLFRVPLAFQPVALELELGGITLPLPAASLSASPRPTRGAARGGESRPAAGPGSPASGP